MIDKHNYFGSPQKSGFRLGRIRTSAIAFVILVSSFGPYIFPNLGVRLDHLVIYLTFILLILTGKMQIPKTSLLLLVFACLLILFFVPMVTLYAENYISFSLVVAQIENYLQVPVLLLIFVIIFHRRSLDDQESLFKRLTIVLMYLLAANTLFSVYIFLAPDSQLVRFFSGVREITGGNKNIQGLNITSVNIVAGRISGVFGLIVEGGFAYALGLFLWVYNYKGRGNVGVSPFALLMAILIGGFFTFSKVFLVIGLPIFLFCVGARKLMGIASILLIFAVLAILINPSLIDTINELRGLNYFLRLIDVDIFNFLSVYTSGRFSSDSAILTGMVKILNMRPFFGLGYGSIETSDFSLYEVVSLGGLIGLSTYLSLHGLMAVLIFKFTKGPRRTLYISFVILTFLSALSAPILTANRLSVFICLILAWALCHKGCKTYNLSRNASKSVL